MSKSAGRPMYSSSIFVLTQCLWDKFVTCVVTTNCANWPLEGTRTLEVLHSYSDRIDVLERLTRYHRKYKLFNVDKLEASYSTSTSLKVFHFYNLVLVASKDLNRHECLSSLASFNLTLTSTRMSIEKYKCPTEAHKERVSQPSTIRIRVQPESHTVSSRMLADTDRWWNGVKWH